MMEGNRDEADRCIDIALTSMNLGNYRKAEKFLRKAENLYPTQKAKDILKHLNILYGSDSSKNHTSTENRNSDSGQTRYRRNVNFNSSTEENKEEEENLNASQHSIEYTKEQLDLVNKIKKCKDYYEVLSVEKEATDSEIKKAYKKLALQLHPDKNSAPGASEAFKAVGNAVATLTDARKRKEYDLYGSRTLNGNGFRGGNDFGKSTSYYSTNNNSRNNYEFAYERGFESDISAEELFNMFFGGFPSSTHRGFNSTGTRYARHTNASSELNQQPSLAFGLILVLIMISMLSSFFTSDPLYSLSQTSKYSVHRQTTHLGVSYYVKQSFNEEYQGSLARLENSVEEEYIATMKQNCWRERSYRDSMIARARSFGNKYQITQAQSLKVPSCDNLVKIGLTRFAIY